MAGANEGRKQEQAEAKRTWTNVRSTDDASSTNRKALEVYFNSTMVSQLVARVGEDSQLVV